MKTDVWYFGRSLLSDYISCRIIRIPLLYNRRTVIACRQKRRRFVQDKVMWSAFRNYANFIMALLSKIKNEMSVTEQTAEM
jgi:hypothetical protein